LSFDYLDFYVTSPTWLFILRYIWWMASDGTITM